LIFGQNRDLQVPSHASGHVEGERALPAAGDIPAMTGHCHVHGTKLHAWVEGASKAQKMLHENERAASLSHRPWRARRVGPCPGRCPATRTWD
jgi:hypothetical protein